jgi:hypothetical protein
MGNYTTKGDQLKIEQRFWCPRGMLEKRLEKNERQVTLVVLHEDRP